MSLDPLDQGSFAFDMLQAQKMRILRRRAEQHAAAIVQAVAELPDRTSPDDWPAAMLVTADELRDIVVRVLEGHG